MDLDRSLDDIIAENRGGRGGTGGKAGKARGDRAAPYKSGGKTCNNCGALGHLAGACPEPNQCHACGSTSHAVRLSPLDSCEDRSGSSRERLRPPPSLHPHRHQPPRLHPRHHRPRLHRPQPPTLTVGTQVADCPHRDKTCDICGKVRVRP